ncbi:MAG: hypothetical protein B7Y08_18510 [Rhodospirillales bacterium 24-66-33]|jgi:hypothetical protein|uniref:hypothetical protein n=1 Tax=Reyranella sp. TaxID=1929291 RepID=UPI000BD5659C|nr:hypothetical protein [Reyranella sp.]OYY40458.1 MAG: hypothetical protein B7Y57_17260 [Rhodospirillales bacterium 35-66-84]OYZ93075.1 MAG: hypothetical protein B7Y08_18510 [Rhodospirillales bacterium 24-66-33]OZB24203.1 MAG: hypothetical protein B7X63_16470 [Rhodospirillales bacterium 39-66-50]HQS18799.1 hypothetical protein [Reyranella sp.]
MKRPSTAKSPKAREPFFLDPAKDSRMRRWAAKIASELPSETNDALLVLGYARGLIEWADYDESPSKAGRRSGR